MPGGGSKKGKRRGGRQLGARNRKTIMREQEIARAALTAGVAMPVSAIKLGLTTLRDIRDYYMGQAASEQRKGEPKNSIIDYALKVAAWCAKEIVQYETPRLAAVMVKQDNEPPKRKVILRLKLGDKSETIIRDEDGRSLTYHEDETEDRTVN